MTAEQFAGELWANQYNKKELIKRVETFAAHVREAAQERYDRNLRDRDRAIERWRTLAEAAQGEIEFLKSKERLTYCVEAMAESNRENFERAETAERKLAELEKAVAQLLDHDGGEGSKDYDASKILVARAALASLRAESKEPVD